MLCVVAGLPRARAPSVSALAVYPLPPPPPSLPFWQRARVPAHSLAPPPCPRCASCFGRRLHPTSCSHATAKGVEASASSPPRRAASAAPRSGGGEPHPGGATTSYTLPTARRHVVPVWGGPSAHPPVPLPPSSPPPSSPPPSPAFSQRSPPLLQTRQVPRRWDRALRCPRPHAHYAAPSWCAPPAPVGPLRSSRCIAPVPPPSPPRSHAQQGDSSRATTRSALDSRKHRQGGGKEAGGQSGGASRINGNGNYKK